MKSIEIEQIWFLRLIIKHLYSSGQIMSKVYLMNRVSLAHKKSEIFTLRWVLTTFFHANSRVGRDVQGTLRTEMGVRGSGLKSLFLLVIIFLWANHNFSLSQFIDLEKEHWKKSWLLLHGAVLKSQGCQVLWKRPPLHQKQLTNNWASIVLSLYLSNCILVSAASSCC